MKKGMLLTVDAIINLALGLVLMVFPAPLIDTFGLPAAEPPFFPTVLGAVLFGIGIALLLESLRRRPGIRGLGMNGAIAINLCGAGALVLWLVSGRLELALPGQIFLWSIAIIVLGVAGIELFAISGQED